MATDQALSTSGLPELLRAQRASRNISMREAARQLEITRMTYAFWEQGVWRPMEDKWTLISNWVDKPLVVVLGALGLLSPEQVDILIASGEEGV